MQNVKNSTTPKWAKQKNKAARHAARIRMARQWLPSYTGTHLVRAYREKFKVDVPTALNDLEEIGEAAGGTETPGASAAGTGGKETAILL